MKKLSSLSVFFPCYNEAANLEKLISEAGLILPEIANKFEIIIVDDGSQDNSAKIVKNLQKKQSEIKFVHHARNLGYGAALRTGFSAARYDWTFFADGDLQFKLAELKTFLPYTEKYLAVIGYRQNRADGGMRVFNASLFKLYINLLFRLHVKDIDCAFKLFKTSLVQSVKLESTGAFTSAELLYKLKKRGIAIKQLPVSHFQRKFGHPTGNSPKVAIKAGFEALKLYFYLKWQQLKGQKNI